MAGNPGGTFTDGNAERWWARKGDDLGQSVWAIGTGLEDDQNARHVRARDSLRLYEGQHLRGLNAAAYTIEAGDEDYNLNISRAACDTVHAEIAGRQKPVAKFQTSDADWTTKRRAKKLEKFCEAILHQRQGTYLNAWELMEDVFLDAAIWGTGVCKVFAEDGKVCLERHFDHELYTDPVEARYGSPQNLFHVYTMDRDKALHVFALDPNLKIGKTRRKQIAAAIEAAQEVDIDVYGTAPRVARGIKIVEAWRLQHAGGKPGKHCFAIDNICLFEEDYERDDFPFVRIKWEPNRMGFHATGLVEQMRPIQEELNENVQRLQERFKVCSGQTTYYVEGSVSEEDLQSNEAGRLIAIKRGADMPKESTARPINEAEFTYMQDVYNKGFQITGVSQMRAEARKEPGVTAGVAIRTLNDMQTARFALKAKGYENAYVALAGQIITCVREVAQEGKFSVRYDEEINWKDVSLPEDTFDITIAPASALPNDPAGRLQMAQELYSAGVIKMETFKQLLGWPDLEKHRNNETSQVRYVEKVVDIMLDKKGATDTDYTAPDPYILDKAGALLQASQAYVDALSDGAPEANLNLVRMYIDDLDALIQKAAEAMVAQQMEHMQMGQAAMGEPSARGPVAAPQMEAPVAAE